MESSTPNSLIPLAELPLLDIHTDLSAGMGRIVQRHYHYHKQAYRHDVWVPPLGFKLSYSCLNTHPAGIRRPDGYFKRVKIARGKAEKCPCLLDVSTTCPHPYYRSLHSILHTKFARPHSLALTYRLSWGSPYLCPRPMSFS